MLNFSELPWKWYVLAFVVIVLDQLTKHWATATIEYNSVERFTSFFYFTLRHNFGAAFSMFEDGGGWQRWFLGSLKAIVSILLIYWIARLRNSHWREPCALALILGGALGNLYDRALMGYVVDFIVFHYEQHAWPAFNIADSAISLGAVLLIWDTVFGKRGQSTGDSSA